MPADDRLSLVERIRRDHGIQAAFIRFVSRRGCAVDERPLGPADDGADGIGTMPLPREEES